MKAVTLFSGGKDSVYAHYKAKQKHDIKCLVSVHPEKKESYMYHHQEPELTELQAKAMQEKLEWIETTAKKEKEVKDLEKGLEKLKNKINFDAVVSGAIKSKYQKKRIEKITKNLNIQSITPLWGINQEKLLKNLNKTGFKPIITKVAAGGLTKNHLGREINQNLIKELLKIKKKWRINVAGEGGEYETLVIDGPNYNKKIELKNTEKKYNQKEQKGKLIIKKAILTNK